VFTVTGFTALLGNVLQQGTFHCPWAHVIGCWRLSTPHRLASISQLTRRYYATVCSKGDSSASHSSSRGDCQPRAVSDCLPPKSIFTGLRRLKTVSRLIGFKVKVMLRLAVYRQSVRLGAKPLETHSQRFFSTEPSLTRGWVYFLWICLAFRQVYVSHIHHAVENSSFCTIYKSSVNTGFAKQSIPILRILWYSVSLVTWTVVSLTTAKYKPLYFLCLASPFPMLRTCWISWFCMTYACCLNGFVI
jgi:hypothetical protein